MHDLLEDRRPEVTYQVRLATMPDNVVEIVRTIDGVSAVEVMAGKPEVQVTMLRTESHADQLLRGLLDHKLTIMACVPSQKHLNQAFMDLTEGGVS